MNFSRLQAYIDRMVSEYRVPGVDCIVYKEHEMVFRYIAGLRDLETQRKLDENTLYLIFSMTKMLTCTCALQLLEQGRYLLSDPLSKYLPEFAQMRCVGSDTGFAKKPITIRDLFTMGAGFDYDLQAAYFKKALAEGKTSTRALIAALSEAELGFEPGTGYRYSLCHDVLGALIEVLSGQTLGEYMQEHLFAPLGMKNTFFGVPKDEAHLSRMATRYTFGTDGMPQRLPLECVYNLSDHYESGGAGLTSCTADYALFLDALANGGIGKNGARILSRASVALMGTNHLTGKPYEDFQQVRPGYGYGLGVRTHTEPTVSGSLSPQGEFGWDGAAGAFSMVDPQNKLAVTYFQHIHGWDIRNQIELRNTVYACID